MSVPKKHGKIQNSHYNSGFFITTNNFPDFKDSRDEEAIRKRLSVFHTKPLIKKDYSVSGKFILYNVFKLMNSGF